MSTGHCIGTATFAISYAREQDAYEHEAAMHDFIMQRLRVVVEETLERYAEPDSVISLDRLEVDLGSVTQAEYREQMEERLRTRLDAQLRDLLQRPHTQMASPPRRSVAQNKWAQLRYYLIHGHFPWHVATTDPRYAVSLLRRCMQEGAARLVATIRSLPARPEICQRLTRQFDLETRRKLVHILSPQHGSVLLDLRQAMSVVIRGANTAYPGEGAAEAAHWEGLFELLLDDVSGTRLERALVDRIVRRRAAHSDEPISRVLQSYWQAVMTATDGGSATVRLAGLLNGLLHERGLSSQWHGSLESSIPLTSMMPEPATSDHAAGQHEDASAGAEHIATDEEAGTEPWYSRPLAMLFRGNVAALESVWERVLCEQPRHLVRALRHAARNSALRRRIVATWDVRKLRQLLRLLSQDHCSFIVAALDRSELWAAAMGLQAEDPVAVHRRFIGYSLDYVVLEANEDASPTAYLHSIAQRLAEESHVDQQVVIERWVAHVARHATQETQEAPGKLEAPTLSARSETSGIFDDQWAVPMKELASLARDRSARQAGAESLRVLSACQLYDSLLEGLSSSKSHEAALHLDRVAIIEELGRDHGHLLLRLYRHLQNGHYPLARWVHAWTARELQWLIRAFMNLAEPNTGGATSHFIVAMEECVKNVGDAHAYYRSVLECLLQGQVVDFAAIAAKQVNAAADAVGPEAPAPEKGDAADAADMAGVRPQALSVADLERAAMALFAYLERGGRRSRPESGRSSRVVEHLCAAHVGDLRTRLPSLLQRRAPTRRIIEILDEASLNRILYALRPADHAIMESYANAMSHAMLAIAPAQPVGFYKRSKWQLLFGYLFEEGRRFQRTDFILRYAHGLAAQVRRRDLPTFRADLAQHLAQDVLPHTRSTHREIITVLRGTQASAPVAGQGEVIDSDAEAVFQERIYIANAGMVLATPYLAQLFDRLGLTTAERFKSREHAERAAHLLQYMVDERCDAPEYQLVLNKLICGIKTGVPMVREIRITDEEREVIDSLLAGMIQHWKALGNTSIAGLREAFLQREGRLERKEDTWQLLVEHKAYDMLLDSIPWGYGTIKLPWMQRVIYVDWR